MTPQHGWFYTYLLVALLLLSSSSSSSSSSSTSPPPSTPTPGSDGKPFSIVLYAKAAKSLNGKAVQAKDSDQQQRARQQPHSVGPLTPSPFRGALSAAGYTMVGPVPGGLRFTKPGDDAVVADAGENKKRSSGEGAKDGEDAVGVAVTSDADAAALPVLVPGHHAHHDNLKARVGNMGKHHKDQGRNADGEIQCRVTSEGAMKDTNYAAIHFTCQRGGAPPVNPVGTASTSASMSTSASSPASSTSSSTSSSSTSASASTPASTPASTHASTPASASGSGSGSTAARVGL